MRIFTLSRVFVVAVCCWLVLGGCAGRLPQTVALSPGEEQEAYALLARFHKTPRPRGLDADIRLGWDVLGSKGGVGATLILQPPSFLRCTAVDPLGRSLVLAASDGSRFTLIDNRVSHVYRGRVDSDFWRRYIPEAVRSEDLLPLLGGFLPPGATKNATLSKELDSLAFWYVWRDERGFEHHALLDRLSGEMRRHLWLEGKGGVVLELNYAAYRRQAESGFSWPGEVVVTGSAVTGKLTVRIEKAYAFKELGAAAFELAPPPHFTEERMP